MTEDKKIIDDEKSPSPWWILLAAVVVIAVLFFFWLSVTSFITEPDKQGQFGDMFGAANTLFSGLAFAGIIYTIWLQRTELKLQRKTLIKTNEEMTLSREAHQSTCNIMSTQLEISKSTAKLENARYRKEVLPRLINNRVNERTGFLGDDHIQCRLNIDNIGKRILSVSIIHLTKDLENIELEVKYPVIESKATFVVNFSCRIPQKYDGSWENFEINFTTEDDSKWKCKFSTFVNEVKPLPIIFEPAIELYNSLSNEHLDQNTES
ncbi:MAG: hypothetical protein CME33_25675 [Gimesia sp.]|uniref:hypothetical protein n=1 Tax=Gimesia sp. TaxID=2024833 RepID=UPI000C44D456|nr:hypothetical protein [Gimesia sp.]MAX39948.1 hypothetical protein [Gimesia sp.]